MSDNLKMHPEPVPAATQLAVLPFLAAIEGLLGPRGKDYNLRVTMHRIMAREKHRYIQQVCTYLGGEKDQSKAGRLFAAGTGLMGQAAIDRKIWRTKHYDELDLLMNDLKTDLKATGSDVVLNSQSPISFLSIPFVGPDNEAVLMLYADTNEFNYFADDSKINDITRMCSSLCALFDWLVLKEPFPSLRNFLTRKVEFRTTPPTAYKTVNEALSIAPPTFERLNSFNFETIPH